MASVAGMTKAGMTLRKYTAMLVLFAWSSVLYAESETVSAIIPWQGQGQLLSAGPDKLRFKGSIEGIMYLETLEGPLNDAPVECVIVQDIDLTTEATSASGNCTIAVSPEDTALAELTCSGMEGYCVGEFKLTGGTGKYSGISGSGKLTVRSPIYTVAQNLSDSSIVQIASGLMQVPELTVTSP